MSAARPPEANGAIVRRQAAPLPTSARSSAPWDASLQLRFAIRNGRTALVERRHAGPLVVQRPLYPHGDAHCETVIVHPPGGIAGGDRLTIDVAAEAQCSVLLTTPGATRWYNAHGRHAEQRAAIHAEDAAVVEWMPLETIVFHGADATSVVRVELSGAASAMGWEIVGFGRRASGERFARGTFRQQIEVIRNGRLIWSEIGLVRGDDPMFDSPIGYAGRSVSGLLWAACPGERSDRWGEIASRRLSFDASGGAAGAQEPNGAAGIAGDPASIHAGITRLPDGIMLARCLAMSTEAAKAWLQRIWTEWRPIVAGRPAIAPRLWST